MVEDNYHCMDESGRYELGEFSTLDAAIQAAKNIADAFLFEKDIISPLGEEMWESCK